MQRLYPALRRWRQFGSGRRPHRPGWPSGERIGAVAVGADGAAQAAQLDESPDADGEAASPRTLASMIGIVHDDADRDAADTRMPGTI